MGHVAKTLSTSQAELQSLMGRRLTYEVCENFHVHWRNVRLELGPADMLRWMQTTETAIAALRKELEHCVVWLPIDTILPWDINHQPADGSPGFRCENKDSTRSHAEGIAWFEKELATFKRGVHPIAVRPVCVAPEAWWVLPPPHGPRVLFQRLDGFKRFMACRNLGHKHIPCFVRFDDAPGCQEGCEPFANDGHRELFDPGKFQPLATEQLGPPEDSPLSRNRVERLTNGQIHVHIGDTRLELTPAEYDILTKLIG